MKTFVIGDIHGAHKALVQCLERSGFDRKNDYLIVLGDVCDRKPDVRACFDELQTIVHMDWVIGNHDLWALDWADQGQPNETWLMQGGRETILSYEGKSMPTAHADMLRRAHPYMVLDGRMFVHAGFVPDVPLEDQTLETFAWSRELIKASEKMHTDNPKHRYDKFTDIFVGHTPTQKMGSDKPLHFCNIWDLDTGAGWSGPLTIMDVDTKAYWQSDSVSQLYPGKS